MKQDFLFYKRAYEDSSQNALWAYMLEYFVQRYEKIAKEKLRTDVLDTQLRFSIRHYCYGSVCMTKDDGHIIIDVRRQDEYDEGHIPGAVLIPNESISDKQPEELPDLNQIILVYCRSGRRSKEASQKLANIGYTNVYEFGGINTWTGEIVN